MANLEDMGECISTKYAAIKLENMEEDTSTKSMVLSQIVN